MKGKFVLTLGFAGVLALSIGFAKELQSTEVSSDKQPKLEEVVTSKQTDTYKLVTREEQDRRERMIVEGKDVYTVITVEEQEMVEICQINKDLYHKKMEQASFSQKKNENKLINYYFSLTGA